MASRATRWSSVEQSPGIGHLGLIGAVGDLCSPMTKSSVMLMVALMVMLMVMLMLSPAANAAVNPAVNPAVNLAVNLVVSLVANLVANPFGSTTCHT